VKKFTFAELRPNSLHPPQGSQREKLTRYGQTVFTPYKDYFGTDTIASVSMHDWSAYPRSLLNPNRLFASKQLLVEED